MLAPSLHMALAQEHIASLHARAAKDRTVREARAARKASRQLRAQAEANSRQPASAPQTPIDHTATSSPA